MDLDSIGTGLTILGTAIGSKELVVKVLGPTADYIGGGLKHWTEKSVNIALISRLTTYQLRAHFIFYHIIKNIFDGELSLQIGSAHDRNKMEVFIPWDTYEPAMDFTDRENETVLTQHIMFGLSKEALIENFASGNVHDRLKHWETKNKIGIVLYPSLLGVELFLWAYGVADVSVWNYLNADLQFPLVADVSIPSGAKRVWSGEILPPPPNWKKP